MPTVLTRDQNSFLSQVAWQHRCLQVTKGSLVKASWGQRGPEAALDSTALWDSPILPAPTLNILCTK